MGFARLYTEALSPEIVMTKPQPQPPHPVQPLVVDDQGVVRFHANAIVRYLLDAGPFDMNHLGIKGFSREDREQFAQLIGYSHSGASDLSYMSNEVLDTAEAALEDPENPQAREQSLRAQLAELRKALRGPMARLFHVHPDDLGEGEDE